MSAIELTDFPFVSKTSKEYPNQVDNLTGFCASMNLILKRGIIDSMDGTPDIFNVSSEHYIKVHILS